jgi:hypothetical protein
MVDELRDPLDKKAVLGTNPQTLGSTNDLDLSLSLKSPFLSFSFLPP